MLISFNYVSMPTVRFVSAIYNLHYTEGGERGVDYPTFLWEHAIRLSAYLPDGLHICCSPEDMRDDLPDSIHLYPLPFAAQRDIALPPQRNLTKDTAAYLTLQNKKPDFLLHVKNESPTDIATFVWIDAGICKVLPSASTLLPRLQTFLQSGPIYPSHKIRIPGPEWHLLGDVQRLTEGIWWRFCGGLVIVPAGLVERFATESHWGCQNIKEQTGRLTWEVNVWTYLEACGRIPFELVPGDHNDTILDALFLNS
jgi:hypothetical protein